jgi:hypothetical protein
MLASENPELIQFDDEQIRRVWKDFFEPARRAIQVAAFLSRDNKLKHRFAFERS